MTRTFIGLVLPVAIAAFVAWILVNAFDSWYHDKEQRRAMKRGHKDHPANGGPRYE